MALWAIADLHLSLGADKPMDVFSGWQDYVPRLEKNWRSVVSPEDTVVIAGDISWAMGLSATEADFAFLHSLPGQKLLLKGNHDYWWTTRKKMETFFAAHGFDDLHIVHNSAYPVDGTYAVCGTRGWFYDAEGEADRRVLLREAERLHTSIRAARETGLSPVCFLHYPPVYGGMVCREIVDVLKAEGITRLYYGHIHGAGIRRALNGDFEGITMRLLSGDAVGFMPQRIP